MNEKEREGEFASQLVSPITTITATEANQRAQFHQNHRLRFRLRLTVSRLPCCCSDRNSDGQLLQSPRADSGLKKLFPKQGETS